MRSVLFLIGLLSVMHVRSQDRDSSGTLRFMPWFFDGPLVLDEQRTLPNDEAIRISQFRFYVCHLVLHTNGHSVPIREGCHLVDADEPGSWDVDLGASASFHPDSIAFELGVDSLLNVSGALGGDLDPTKGMYWAWNSGYINLKLEGSTPLGPYPKGSFELHLGGYLPPYATAQRVVLKPSKKGPLTVRVDVSELLVDVDLKGRCNVMSPGAEAVRLSRRAVSMFKIDAAP